jgi:hypothetical protein
VSLAYNGFTPAGTPTVYTLANNATSITSATGSASSGTATLTWTWPSSGESITQMWSAPYTQAADAVSTVNASYDATIGASGGTVTARRQDRPGRLIECLVRWCEAAA